MSIYKNIFFIVIYNYFQNSIPITYVLTIIIDYIVRYVINGTEIILFIRYKYSLFSNDLYKFFKLFGTRRQLVV